MCKIYFSIALFPQTFLLVDQLWLRKTTTDPHILAEVSPNDRYTMLKIYISQLISDRYEYMRVAYVTTHCMMRDDRITDSRLLAQSHQITYEQTSVELQVIISLH